MWGASLVQRLQDVQEELQVVCKGCCPGEADLEYPAQGQLLLNRCRYLPLLHTMQLHLNICHTASLTPGLRFPQYPDEGHHGEAIEPLAPLERIWGENFETYAQSWRAISRNATLSSLCMRPLSCTMPTVGLAAFVLYFCTSSCTARATTCTLMALSI